MKLYNFLQNTAFKNLNNSVESDFINQGVNYDKNLLIVENEEDKKKYLLDYGKYYSLKISLPELINFKECIIHAKNLAKVLKKYFVKDINGKKILVVGLGNRYITADSLGECTLKYIITNQELTNNRTTIYTFTPNVMGITNIETAELIEQVCKLVTPDIIIAIDSLCAVSCDRLCSSIQISNSGIEPGAGIYNKRKALSKKLLKCEIISIGVPLMIHQKDVFWNLLNKSYIENLNLNKPKLDKIVFNKLIKRGSSIVFTDSQINAQIKNFSRIIGMAINLLLSSELGI